MSQPTGAPSNLDFMLRAFRSRNFRLFFAGQSISLTGTWLSFLATSWLVYRLASQEGQPEALMLGLVGFAANAPSLVLTPLAGVTADRLNRHSILLWTQSLAMVQSFVLAGLALSGWITIWQLMLLSMVRGMISAFDLPTRQSFLVEMVDAPQDLSNAIALNSSMFHGARMIGPAIAGYLIYWLGHEGYCFLIDGFSYLAVLCSLVVMRIKPRERPVSRSHPLAQLREGARYAFGFRPIRALLMMAALTSFSSMTQTTLLPIFAAEILHGNASTLGWLLAAAGMGALAGSLYLAARRSVLGLGKVMVLASGMLGLGLVGLALSDELWLSWIILVVNGAAIVTEMASANTLVQTIVEDDKRGRVMSLFTLAFFGTAPIASLASGAVAQAIGARWTIAIAGVLSLAAAVAFALLIPGLRTLVHPIYRSKGILPPAGETQPPVQSEDPRTAAGPAAK